MFIDGCNCLHKLISYDKTGFNVVDLLKKNTFNFINYIRDELKLIPCVIFDGYRSSEETVEKLISRRREKIIQGRKGIPYCANQTFNDILLELNVCTFTCFDCDCDDVVASYANHFPGSFIFSSDKDFLSYEYVNKPKIIYHFYYNFKFNQYVFLESDREFMIDNKVEEEDCDLLDTNELKQIDDSLIRTSSGEIIDICVYDCDPVEFSKDKKICQFFGCECILLKHKNWRMGQSYIGVKLMGNNRKNTKKLRQAIYYKIFNGDLEVRVKESYFDWDFEKDDLYFFEEDVKPDNEMLDMLLYDPKECFNICYPESYIKILKDKFSEKFGEDKYWTLFVNEMYSIYSCVYYYHSIVTRQSFANIIKDVFNIEIKCNGCNDNKRINIVSYNFLSDENRNLFLCKSCKRMKKGVCSHWLNGYCSRKKCIYYHDPNVNFNKDCKHYLNPRHLGKCLSGNNCMYNHDKLKLQKLLSKRKRNRRKFKN